MRLETMFVRVRYQVYSFQKQFFDGGVKLLN